MTKYLDLTGVTYLWSKIKNLFKLSTSYSTSTATNEDLKLAASDSYDTAFGKLEKAILDNEDVTSSALNDLDSKVDGKVTKVSGTTDNIVLFGANGAIKDSGKKLSDLSSADTKNTTGSTADANKLYIVGAKTQADSPVTYSQANAYITAGKVYSNAKEVVNLSDTQTLTNKSLTSPKLTGTPTAPTASAGTNTTQVATTAFVTGGFIPTTAKGTANGVVPLNESTKIDATYLPSYVDDVIEVYPRSGLTALSSSWLSETSDGTAITPEKGKIYVLMETVNSGGEVLYKANSQFRWGGSAYVPLYDGGASALTNSDIDSAITSAS